MQRLCPRVSSRAVFACALASFLVLSACRSGGDGGGNVIPEDAGAAGDASSDTDAASLDFGMVGRDLGEPLPKVKWTVFVYGHADHNLSNSLVRDIAEMAEAELHEDVRVVVLADFDASQTLGDGDERFPTGALWMLVEGSGAEPRTLAEDPELDLDDPKVLESAVGAAFSHFPSERRALVLWDHGGAWSGGFGGDSQDGRRSEPTPLYAAEVASAIAAGLTRAGIDTRASTPALDLFSFDACLMAGVEVAWEFRELTSAYIGNAELDYGDGWDYAAFLTHLSSNQDDSAIELARAEVELWDAHHEGASINDTLLRSHVALDVVKLDAFATAFAALSWLLADTTTLSDLSLGSAAYFTLPPYMNQLENPTSTPELRDVGQFLERLSNVQDAEVAQLAAAAYEALDAAVLGRSHGSVRQDSGQSGVHVQLPLAVDIDTEMLTAYETLASAWNSASAWSGVLERYRRRNDGLAPDFSVSIENDVAPDAANLPQVTFGSADPDLAEVEVNLARIDPITGNELLIYGLVGKGPVEADQLYGFTWDGQIPSLPDGEGGMQPVFLRIWEEVGASESAAASGGPILAIFGVVIIPGQVPAMSALLFQDDDAEASVVALFDPPVTLTLEDLARDAPGSTFTPVVVSVSLSSGEETLFAGSPLVIDQGSLPIGSVPASSGSYGLITAMTDVFGNAASDLQTVQLTLPIQP